MYLLKSNGKWVHYTPGSGAIELKNVPDLENPLSAEEASKAIVMGLIIYGLQMDAIPLKNLEIEINLTWRRNK